MIAILILSIFNMLFPILGIFIIVPLTLLSPILKINIYYYQIRALVIYNLSYSLAVISFLYKRTSEGGDVFQYERMLKSINDFELTFDYYYSWVYLLKVYSNLGLSISHVNFTLILINYICIFYIFLDIYFLSLNACKDKFTLYKLKYIFGLILFKFLFLISIITLSSSYRNTVAFSLTFLGIYLLMIKSRFVLSVLFIFLGIGFHPSSLIIVISYLISKYIKFKSYYIVISLSISYSLITIINNFIINNSILSNFLLIEKLDYYTNSQWAGFSFTSLIEYYIVFSLYIFVLFAIILIFLLKLDDINIFYKKLNYYILIPNRYKNLLNFTLIYFSISLLFMSLRTMADRFLLSAGSNIIIILILFLFILLFNNIKYHKIKYFMIFIWLINFDMQLIYFTQKSYIIGNGFPYNLIYSPFFTLD